MALLNDDEFVEIEGRQYLRPEIALNEANTFIDNLRNSQQANNQQIQMQTYNLGTEVPSNLGGLTGGNSYFTSRYQVPQTASAVADLRATAQAAALNQVLQNEQDIWKKRYNDAYRAYQKRSWDNSKGGTGGGSDSEEGDVEFEDTSSKVEITPLTGASGKASVVDPASGVVTDVDLETGENTSRGYTTYSSKDIGRRAGADQLSDIFTGMYNYTIPGEHGDIEFEEGGWDEELRKGSDGYYYVWNRPNNTYTRITGDYGSTPGGSRWWKKG